VSVCGKQKWFMEIPIMDGNRLLQIKEKNEKHQFDLAKHHYSDVNSYSIQLSRHNRRDGAEGKTDKIFKSVGKLDEQTHQHTTTPDKI
jgi:hypothetical protein